MPWGFDLFTTGHGGITKTGGNGGDGGVSAGSGQDGVIPSGGAGGGGNLGGNAGTGARGSVVITWVEVVASTRGSRPWSYLGSGGGSRPWSVGSVSSRPKHGIMGAIRA